MNLYDQYQTDPKIEREGIVLNYGKLEDGTPIDIRIARAGGANAKFDRTAEQAFKPVRRQLNNESIDPEVLQGLFRTIYARSVVLGWTGIVDREGKKMEFTEDNVVKLFTDLPDLFKDVREAAEKASLFRLQALEDESKN